MEKQFISVRLPKSTILRIEAALRGQEINRSQWLREAIEWKLSVKLSRLPGPRGADRPTVVSVEE